VKRPNLEGLSIFELCSMFEKASLVYGQAMERGDPRVANRESGVIRVIYKEWKRRGTEGQSAAINLMRHKEPWVRLQAAGFSIHFAPQRAEPVLLDLATQQKGDCGFIAEKTIALWREGRLSPVD
jgi:hypothetical protein